MKGVKGYLNIGWRERDFTETSKSKLGFWAFSKTGVELWWQRRIWDKTWFVICLLDMEELHEGGRRRSALLLTGAVADHKSNNLGHSSSSSSSSCSSSPPPRHSGGAAAAATTTTAPDSQQQQQQLNIVGDGSVDIHGKPSNKATSGRWKAAYFLMGTDCTNGSWTSVIQNQIFSS